MLKIKLPSTSSVFGQVFLMSFKPNHLASRAILSHVARGPERSACFLMALSITPALTTLNLSLSCLDASQIAKLHHLIREMRICQWGRLGEVHERSSFERCKHMISKYSQLAKFRLALHYRSSIICNVMNHL